MVRFFADEEKLLSFYKGRKVLITGHTGFKGAWLSYMLWLYGAEVCGYALDAPTDKNMFDILGLSSKINSIYCDLCDMKSLKYVMNSVKPEIVFHLGAQSIVKEGYAHPYETYLSNTVGSLNVIEAIRGCSSVKSYVNITTDKVYENSLEDVFHTEEDRLDGFDPYANSKSCSELITSTYVRSCFDRRRIGISTMRAGNVIGGGDFADNRIVPDCVRSIETGTPILIRNPYSIRPFQHVLDALSAYLLIGALQYYDDNFSGAWNVGPDPDDMMDIITLVETFSAAYGSGTLTWETNLETSRAFHESGCLRLSNDKIAKIAGWRPKWKTSVAIEKTAEWVREYFNGKDMCSITAKQIEEHLSVPHIIAHRRDVDKTISTTHGSQNQ